MGTDITLDIYQQSSDANQGKFAFLIISTYPRGDGATLADWISQNGGDGSLSSIVWGNSLEALQSAKTGRLFALTKHQIVVLEMNTGTGNLDLNAQMANSLPSWYFGY